MKHHILVTGGAGFIGSHLVDRLIGAGQSVRVFDNLEPQVHKGKLPSYRNKKAQYVRGDVRERSDLKKAMQGADVIFHLASSVGVAQSNYEIKKYTDTNVGGISNMWDIIVNDNLRPRKIILVASMTSYGEGLYRCPTHGVVHPPLRGEAQLAKRDWEVRCPTCQKPMRAIHTTEGTPRMNNSIYSITKNVQETMLLHLGGLYDIPVVSLRCFNVYGSRQSLSNPYTGVSAIFLSRLLNDHAPVVYEDGEQSRDFVSVHDVVSALVLAMERKQADHHVINIGSGKPIAIKDVASTLATLLGKSIKPKMSGEYRVNDIRHCFADIQRARTLLGWRPRVSFEEGMRELIAWSRRAEAVDMFEAAQAEFRAKTKRV